MGDDDKSMPGMMNIIYVGSVEKSKEFYTKTLGFEDEGSYAGDDGKTLAHADLGWKGMTLMIERKDSEMIDKDFAQSAREGPLGRGVFLYFMTDDLDRTFETAKKNGVRVSVPPTDLSSEAGSARFCSLRDPDGYAIGFIQIPESPRKD